MKPTEVEDELPKPEKDTIKEEHHSSSLRVSEVLSPTGSRLEASPLTGSRLEDPAPRHFEKNYKLFDFFFIRSNFRIMTEFYKDKFQAFYS